MRDMGDTSDGDAGVVSNGRRGRPHEVDIMCVSEVEEGVKEAVVVDAG
jgi:hypothetical protein